MELYGAPTARKVVTVIFAYLLSYLADAKPFIIGDARFSNGWERRVHQAQQRTEPRALFIWAPMRLADREMAPFRTPITRRLSHDGSSKSAVCVLSLPGSHHNTVQEAPSDGQMHLLGIPLVQRCRGVRG